MLGTVLAVTKPMKLITMKSRSSTGAWSEHSLPPWISMDALVDARRQFQAIQGEKSKQLGYCARTSATSWLDRNKPEWGKRLGTGFDSLIVAYALCLEPKAVKFVEREV